MNTLAETKSETGDVTQADEHHDKPHYDDVDVPSVVTLGVVSGLVTYIVIVFVQGLYYKWEASQIEAKEYGRPVAAAKAIAQQKESLTGYLQAKEGSYQESIPVDRAMLLVVKELKGNDEKQENTEEKSADDHSSGKSEEDPHQEKDSPESKHADQSKSADKEKSVDDGEPDAQPKEQPTDDPGNDAKAE